MMIGGGLQECRAIKVAKSLGFEVIVTDRNPMAPGFHFADFKFVIDGRDIEKLIAFALLNKKNLNIAGIFTLTELVTSVAATAHAINLPGVSIKSAVTCQNKAICKIRWQEAGVPTPRGGIAFSFEEAKTLFEELGEEVFVKPAVGFGGQGAKKVTSISQLKKLFSQEENFSKFDPLLVEECAIGSMHDINGLIDSNGVFHPLGIVDRFFLDNRPVEKEIRSPSTLNLEQQKALYELVEVGVKALGINFGPVKADAVLTNTGFKLLEVAPRLHGPKNSLYVLPMSGFEPLIPTLFAITRQTIPQEKLKLNQMKYCICRALLPESGRILNIVGISKARTISGVEHIMLFVKKGDIIRHYQNSTHVPGYIFVTGKSFKDCEKILERVESTIYFEMRKINKNCMEF